MRPLHPDIELRILHTSDVHIDSIAACAAVKSIVDAANRLEVDLLIIAGDLFDNARISDEVVYSALTELKRLRMPPVLIPGNHDQLDDRSIYRRVDIKDVCPSLRFISAPEGETLDFDELNLRVWGRAMEDHNPGFHPLEGVPPRNDGLWHLAMGHGYFFPSGQVPDRSSPILSEEIEATGYDYVALGHCHVFRDISQKGVKAFYSGEPHPPFQEEEQGHVALVHLHPAKGVRVERVPLS